jgi:hypothetical protein
MGSSKKGAVPEFLNQMADDIGVGPRVIVKKMVDSLKLLYDTDIDMDRKVDLVAEVIDGCEMSRGSYAGLAEYHVRLRRPTDSGH